MSTAYHQEPKRSRKRNINKETGTSPPNGKYLDENLDLSTISYRDLRSGRSSIKNSTFDKSDLTMTKTSIDNATEPNWIVSELTSKENGRHSYKNTSSNDITYDTLERKSEHLNNSNTSNKKLRKTRLDHTNSTFNNSDQIINVTYEKDSDGMKVIEKKEVTTNDKSKTVEQSELGLDNDTENDLNSLNVEKTSKHKKKKGKGSRKKKQKKAKDIRSEDTSENVDILNTTFEKENNPNGTSPSNKVILSSSKTNVQKDIRTSSSEITRSRKSSIKNTTFDKEDKLVDTTYEKDEILNRTFEKDSESIEVYGGNFKQNKSIITPSDKNDKKSQKSRKSSKTDVSLNNSNTTSVQCSSKDIFDKEKSISASPACKRMSLRRQTMDIINSPTKILDTTFDKESKFEKESKERSSRRWSEVTSRDKLNVTFDKEDIKDSHCNSKSSLISSDNSSISRVSITSDESIENIVNTTPLLIESSIDETLGKESPKQSSKGILPVTPLKREGTFTKEVPELPQTPGKRESSIISAAGCTPYHVSKSSQKKPMLNVTQSIEKRLSIDLAHRMTRVMFCSPIDNPTSIAQEKRKIIKSNLKGSNKSFVFDESSKYLYYKYIRYLI